MRSIVSPRVSADVPRSYQRRGGVSRGEVERRRLRAASIPVEGGFLPWLVLILVWLRLVLLPFLFLLLLQLLLPLLPKFPFLFLLALQFLPFFLLRFSFLFLLLF